jgi:hypothetical protein
MRAVVEVGRFSVVGNSSGRATDTVASIYVGTDKREAVRVYRKEAARIRRRGFGLVWIACDGRELERVALELPAPREPFALPYPAGTRYGLVRRSNLRIGGKR